MQNRRNYYRLLQVQPDAPVEVIRSSFRTLMRELKHHPDLGGSTPDAALLNEAYRVLTNPALRAEYDRDLFARFPRQSVSGAAAHHAAREAASCPFCKTALPAEPEPGARCPTCQSPLCSRQDAELAELSRRAMARMKRDDRITYRSQWPQDSREARVLDLSPTGIRLRCPEEFPSGTILKLSGDGIEATASVKFSRKAGAFFSTGAAFIAVEFENPRGFFFSTSA